MSSINYPQLKVVSLRAENLHTAVHFYSEVIGLRLLPQHQHPPAFDLGNDCLMVIMRGKSGQEQDKEEERFPIVAFAVEDLETAVEGLQAHGVALPWGVEAGAGSRWVMFYDPAGNLIELVQPEHPAHG